MFMNYLGMYPGMNHIDNSHFNIANFEDLPKGE